MKENGYRQYNTAYVEISKKNGKQLALDTPLPTPDGFKNMGEIKVGDKVFDENGIVCCVVAKSEVDDTEQAYRLTFRDGSSIIAGENHLWDLEYIRGKAQRKIWKTKEIYDKTQKFREKYKDNPKEIRRSIIRMAVHQTVSRQVLFLMLLLIWLSNARLLRKE